MTNANEHAHATHASWTIDVNYQSAQRKMKTGYSTIRSASGEEKYIGSVLNEHAALVAAAPDLLDALRLLTDHAQEQYPHFESERGQKDIAVALAAIRKAEGSTRP